ncbi:hypothetical protein Acor_46380 [Acrocarpospora corrugata]|uniref:Glycine-rich protein n=1 Tax=Acrocarpospora corrugata TaxID=35763 RepID=A0A5M3W3G5_9ACTN|nr:PE-PGRS family protein [Acrocarpospora corrugata]GES02572.1 hypothetical protein Acor_46380 [Acrocarpospora corrugata]
MIRPLFVSACVGAALFAAPAVQADSYTAQDQARCLIPLPIIDTLCAGLGLGGASAGGLFGGGLGGPLGGSGGGVGAGGPGGLGTGIGGYQPPSGTPVGTQVPAATY